MHAIELYNNTSQQISNPNSIKETKKKFTKTFDLSQIAEDPMDSYLDSLGLWKKRIARDGSCLFRAVAEQIYPCQQYHEKVRLECLNYMYIHRDEYSKFLSPQISFDNYLEAMKNPLEYGGQLEIAAMSKLYKKDFIIHQHTDKPGINATQNNYTEKIYLCYSFNNHFDAIFTKTHRDNLAFTQSLVYEILYDKVFGSAEQINIARHLLRKSDTIYPKEFMKNDFEDNDIELELFDSNNNTLIHENNFKVNILDNQDVSNNPKNKNQNLQENCLYNNKNSNTNNITSTRAPLKNPDYEYNDKNQILIQKMPLPYKVAKSLDPLIYRNTAFDAWLAAKKEYEETNTKKSFDLQQGDKCLVKLNDNINEKWNIAYVHNIMNDSANVYLPELNEHHCVVLDNLKPYTNLNDLSLIHQSFKNQHSTFSILNSNIGNIQNVQKFVQSVNTEFSKIFINIENKRKNIKKKHLSLKKSSSFHAFSTVLPALIEVEEHNDDFLFYTNQIYRAHNSYLRAPDHHPIHLNVIPSQEFNHTGNELAKSYKNNHYLTNKNVLPNAQTQQNNNDTKNDNCSINKTQLKKTASASAISSINMTNSLDNSFIRNNNSLSKSRRHRFQSNNSSHLSHSNNIIGLDSQNNKILQNNQIFIGPNPPSFIGPNHHSLPPLGANQILRQLQNPHVPDMISGFNHNPMNITAPLIRQPGPGNFLPPANLHHSNVNQNSISVAPPPLPFIHHQSPLSHSIAQQTIHPHTTPLIRPNYFNPISSPFLIAPLPQQLIPGFIPPHQNTPLTTFESFNDIKTVPYTFPNAAVLSTGKQSKNSSNSFNSKNNNFSYSFDQQRKKDNVESLSNKHLNTCNKKNINNSACQQVPHNQSKINMKDTSNNLTPIRASANANNYLLMPAPPSGLTNNSNQILNILPRSHSYHSGIMNSPYDKNENEKECNNLNTDVYSTKSHQTSLYQNTASINLTNIPVNNNTGNTNNPICVNPNTIQQYSNNSIHGFENFNLTYNENNFSSYEMQYGRLNNSLNSSNCLNDVSFETSTDTRHMNKLKSNKNVNIFSDKVYESEPTQGSSNNTISNTNNQLCYSNCFVVNIDGPINFNSTHSLLDDGSDLPLNDINTMRFFYNLGIEYYRLNLPSVYNQATGFYPHVSNNNSNTNNSNTLPNISSNQISANIPNGTTSLENCNIQQDQQLIEKQHALSLTNQQVVPNSATSFNNSLKNHSYNSRVVH